MKQKAPKPPKVAAPIPVPQQDSPELIETRRRVRSDAEERQGMRASLLTPGGDQGVRGSDASRRRRLGLGSIASTAA